MSLRADQLEAASELADRVLRSDNFNSRRLRAAGLTTANQVVENWEQMPFTTKQDLLDDATTHAPWGSIATEPLAGYTRFCQTSGTSTGQPLAWLDTPDSWRTLLECWNQVFDAAELVPGEDRLFFAFSFGPFLGFWTAFEAAANDYLVIPSGGMSSEARIAAILRYGATVLCCTPTYALRLGEMLPPGANHHVRKLIVAGEAGGSVPQVRARLSELWGAQVFDHHGMTEVGPVTYQTADQPGVLQIIHSAYHAEIIDPATGAPADEGELVLTTLLRSACPLLRYRTGDWVRRTVVDGQLCLAGGILGRCDDMVVIRGVNIYPSAVDNLIRGFPNIVEYQVKRHSVDAMEELRISIEPTADCNTRAELVSQLERLLKDTFSLRIPVDLAAPGSLPRYEFKAKRWLRNGA
jgi:phenylacetate-CoA ligase